MSTAVLVSGGRAEFEGRSARESLCLADTDEQQLLDNLPVAPATLIVKAQARWHRDRIATRYPTKRHLAPGVRRAVGHHAATARTEN
jgi:hypothetical protein